jgi:hypothetical protein
MHDWLNRRNRHTSGQKHGELGPAPRLARAFKKASGLLDESIEALRHGRQLLNEQGLRSHLPWASAYLARTLARQPHASAENEARTIVVDGVEVARSLGMEVMEAHLRAIEVPS